MIIDIFLIVLMVSMLGILAVNSYFVWSILKNRNTNPPITIDNKPVMDYIDQIPKKVLTSIQNSTNTYKGALGELIGYINLRASYDRIIPLGNIADFIAIKFETDDHPGCIDFIDVKTGHKARLSKDQRALQKLIKEKKINFCQLKIEASNADFSK